MVQPNEDMQRFGYSTVQIWLHWLTAGMVVAQFLINADLRAAFRERLGGGEPYWPEAIGAGFHLVSGMAILGLTLLRLMIKLRQEPHPPGAEIPAWLHLFASLAHWALYAGLLGMTGTGLLAWWWGSELFATLHEIGRWLFLILILAHVIGALIEHHWLKNPVLEKITKPLP